MSEDVVEWDGMGWKGIGVGEVGREIDGFIGGVGGYNGVIDGGLFIVLKRGLG